MIYFFVFSILVFFLLSIWRPNWVVFLIIFLLPAYQIRFSFFGLPLTLLEAMILILFFVRLIINRTQYWQLGLLKNWWWPIILWLAIGFLAVLIAPDLVGALGYWRAYFLEPILLLVVIVDLVGRDQELKKHLIFSLGLSALICALWAISQKWLGGGVMSTEVWGAAKVWRATGPFPQPNFLGLYLGPIAILAFGQIINFWRKNLSLVIFYPLVILFSFWAIWWARSEGAILGILVALIFLGLIYKNSRRLTLASLMIIVLAIIIFPSAQHYFVEKITFRDLSEQLRLNIWQGAESLIKDHPILGVGLRGYQKLIPQYQKAYYQPETHQLISVETHPYPHNLFLAIWAELGILGLIVFFWILWRFFSQGFLSNHHNYIFLAPMITILAHGLVDTPYFKNDLAILFWLIVALINLNRS